MTTVERSRASRWWRHAAVPLILCVLLVAALTILNDPRSEHPRGGSTSMGEGHEGVPDAPPDVRNPGLHGRTPPILRGPVDVRVFVRGEQPWSGATVELRQEGRRWSGVTDTQGSARFADIPYDGSAVARLVGPRATMGTATQGEVVPLASSLTIRGPVVRVSLPGLIPATLRFVDAQSGAQLPISPHSISGGYTTLNPNVVLLRVAYSEVRADMRLRAIPEGRVVSTRHFVGAVSPFAKRLLWVTPVYREAHIRLSPLAQSRFDKLDATATTLGGLPVDDAFLVEEPGDTWLLRGVPFLAGERIRIRLAAKTVDSNLVATLESVSSAGRAGVVGRLHPLESTILQRCCPAPVRLQVRPATPPCSR